MKIIFIVLFSLLLLAATALVIWYMLLRLKGSERIILSVIAGVGMAIVLTLLILAACIPSKADQLLTLGIHRIEAEINNVTPGYTNQAMTAEQLEKALSNTKQWETALEEDNETTLAIQLIGAGAYMNYLKDFLKSVDANVAEMQAAGTDITIHNVLLRLQDKSRAPILKASKVIEVIIIVLGFVLILSLIIAWAILRNEEKNGPKVVLAVDEEKA